jgi:hypothetical protein
MGSLLWGKRPAPRSQLLAAPAIGLANVRYPSANAPTGKQRFLGQCELASLFGPGLLGTMFLDAFGNSHSALRKAPYTAFLRHHNTIVQNVNEQVAFSKATAQLVTNQ